MVVLRLAPQYEQAGEREGQENDDEAHTLGH